MSAATPFPSPLGNAESELRRLFEHAPFGVAQCSRQGSVTALNAALERMMGGRERIARCFSACDLIDPHGDGESRRLFRELFDGDRESFEFSAESGSATRTFVHWTAWHVRGSGDKPDYALAFADETVEQRNALQRLSEARLAILGRLTGGVAHDFNNLLTGVLLYCELLMAGLEGSDRLHAYATQIRSATLQATGLVGQLLRLARPDSPEPSALSLNDSVEGMRTLLIRMIGENIELDLRLDPKLGLVKMDPTQVQQVLLNLVLNARDAMPQGGRICVETCNSSLRVLSPPESRQSEVPLIACALLTVSDDGDGMDVTTRGRLFEPFFTTKVAGKGNGLGLKTVHDIVSSSGGLIQVDSAKNSGTRVTILLPLAPVVAVQDSTPNDTTSRPLEGDLPPIAKD
jgi:two-component system cell cycle sensor histidine kinase/response regulator CckA